MRIIKIEEINTDDLLKLIKDCINEYERRFKILNDNIENIKGKKIKDYGTRRN